MMLKKIVVIALIALAVLLAYASTKPDVFRVERSVSIQAPAAKIFPFINDLQKFGLWSPFEKLDPNMKKTFTGPTAGTGAKYAWEGNKNAGAGSMEIVESVLPTAVTFSLDFEKPFKAHNTVEFTLAPQGDATLVTWAMHGPQPYFAKVISLILNCEKMIGPQFEEGLASLKALAEKQ